MGLVSAHLTPPPTRDMLLLQPVQGLPVQSTHYAINASIDSDWYLVECTAEQPMPTTQFKWSVARKV